MLLLGEKHMQTINFFVPDHKYKHERQHFFSSTNTVSEFSLTISLLFFPFAFFTVHRSLCVGNEFLSADQLLFTQLDTAVEILSL